MLKIKRAYEKIETDDGKRILVDRLWPRGISRVAAGIDEWQKDLSPSDELRRWFGHDPDKWTEFREKYLAELSSPEKLRLLDDIADAATHSNVTLIYGAKDTEHNNARVLEEKITKIMKKVSLATS